MSERRALERFLAGIRGRIRNVVARGVVTLVRESPLLEEVQLRLLAGELRGPLERFQEYGFTSHPHPGAEAIALFHGGRRAHGLVIAVDDRRYRLLGLAEGEVALYDDLGTRIVLRRGKRVEVRATELDAVLEADALVDAGGKATVRSAGDLLAESTGGKATVKAATIARLEGADVQIVGTTSVSVDAPLVDIQGKGDFKLHDHSPVDDGDGTTGPVD